MMLLPPMESFIPKDHYLRRLDKVLDLDFIHEIVKENYCQTNGRPSIDPEVIIRLFLIQAMDGITQSGGVEMVLLGGEQELGGGIIIDPPPPPPTEQENGGPDEWGIWYEDGGNTIKFWDENLLP